VRRHAATRAGIWLTLYAAGGSIVGVVGFGLLWSGAEHEQWARAILGLALLALGLDRAGTALNISLRSRHAVATLRLAGKRPDSP